MSMNPVYTVAAFTSALKGFQAASSNARDSIKPSYLDNYIKLHFDRGDREIGFRIGVPILDWEIRQQPSQRTKWTDYNEIEVHGFHLRSVDADGMSVGLSMRWKQFERIPLTNRRYKRAETNCNAVARIRLLVTENHRIAQRDPLISGIDCTTSGFGLEQITDYMLQGLTWVVTGGQSSFGLFDVFAGFGTVIYDFAAFFRSAQIDLSDPVHRRFILNEHIPFIRKIYELDELHVEFFLKEIRYDSKGIWLIFGWASNLDDVVLPVASMVGLG